MHSHTKDDASANASPSGHNAFSRNNSNDDAASWCLCIQQERAVKSQTSQGRRKKERGAPAQLSGFQVGLPDRSFPGCSALCVN